MSKILKGLILTIALYLGGGTGLEASDRINVVTTLFPVYDFTREIGKEHLKISLLVPPGVETHAFEPTPRDIIRINNADLFIYTGEEMEPWVKEILSTLENQQLLILDASQGIQLRKLLDQDLARDHDSGHHHHHGEQVEKDPHFWLDLQNSQVAVAAIAKALIQIDPKNREGYLKNKETYQQQLNTLDQRFQTELSSCRFRTLISGGHLTFGYLTDRYHLKYISAYKGFSPNAEPSPKSIGRLIKTLQDSKLKTVYYEELINPKIARIISQETGARMELLHGAHNISRKEMNKGTRFTDLMESNLEKLKAGLECH